MKGIKYHLIILLIAFSACKGKEKQRLSTTEPKVFADSLDQNIFHSIQETADRIGLSQKNNAERCIAVAKMFLQTPYVGGTLESNGEEKMVLNLRELDCTTYLENVVAFTRASRKKDFSATDFESDLEFLRYRSGKRENYASRLHYFSDWLYENEQKGILKNKTSELGGVPYAKTINFMSTHVDAYPALQADSSLLAQIKSREDSINQRKLYYISEDKIEQIEDSIEDGDLIAITTKITGLDISHVGIALHVNNRLHLMHASSLAKKVVISEIPLADMLKESRLQSGIMIARLQEKNQ